MRLSLYQECIRPNTFLLWRSTKRLRMQIFYVNYSSIHLGLTRFPCSPWDYKRNKGLLRRIYASLGIWEHFFVTHICGTKPGWYSTTKSKFIEKIEKNIRLPASTAGRQWLLLSLSLLVPKSWNNRWSMWMESRESLSVLSSTIWTIITSELDATAIIVYLTQSDARKQLLGIMVMETKFFYNQILITPLLEKKEKQSHRVI